MNPQLDLFCAQQFPHFWNTLVGQAHAWNRVATKLQKDGFSPNTFKILGCKPSGSGDL